MLYDLYVGIHNMGLHFWDLPMLIVVIAMVVVGLVHGRNQKKRESDWEDEMKEKENLPQEG